MLNKLVILTFLMSFQARAWIISAASKGENDSLYIALKANKHPTPILLKWLPLEKKRQDQLKTPTELKGHEIKFMIPTTKGLVTIAQYNPGPAAKPVVWNFHNNEWKKLDELKCEDIDFTSFDKGTLSYDCYTKGKDGRDVKTAKTQLMLENAIHPKTNLKTPVKEFKVGDKTVKLSGFDYDWDGIELDHAKTSVDELLK